MRRLAGLNTSWHMTFIKSAGNNQAWLLEHVPSWKAALHLNGAKTRRCEKLFIAAMSLEKKKKNSNVSIWIYACLCLCTDRQYNKSPCRVTVSRGAATRSYVTQNALRVNPNCTSNPCIDKEFKKKNVKTWIWRPSEIRKRNHTANTAENKTILREFPLQSWKIWTFGNLFFRFFFNFYVPFFSFSKIYKSYLTRLLQFVFF